MPVLPTSSTVPAVKTALVSTLTARPTLSAQVSRRWPGPNTEHEGVYLGDVEGESRVSSLKPGRQRRQETYVLQVVCQTFHSAHTPLDAGDSEARAYALLAELEGALADDPRLGDAAGVSAVLEFGTWTEETVPFERGWATRITAGVRVSARLT